MHALNEKPKRSMLIGRGGFGRTFNKDSGAQ
jgi:hypothetical protein